MNAPEMWEIFSSQHNVTCQYDAWTFGDDPDALAALVLEGVKTATSSGYPWYAADGEPLPKEGAYSIILSSTDEAVCIVRNTKVYITEFENVSAEHARKEGEGDRSLAFWRDAHERFFKQCDSESGTSFFHEKMKVVCEEFEKVFP